MGLAADALWSSGSRKNSKSSVYDWQPFVIKDVLQIFLVLRVYVCRDGSIVSMSLGKIIMGFTADVPSISGTVYDDVSYTRIFWG